MARSGDSTGRNLAVVGGGAALLWLLLRRGNGDGDGAASESVVTTVLKPPRARVRVDATGITVDGQAVDVATAAAIVKQRAEADVLITGAARSGTADDLMRALRATGAELHVTGYEHA